MQLQYINLLLVIILYKLSFNEHLLNSTLMLRKGITFSDYTSLTTDVKIPSFFTNLVYSACLYAKKCDVKVLLDI